MKKLLAFSVMLLLSALLAVGAFAAEKTVYLASTGDDACSGTGYADAVKTVERAYALIGENDGRIIVCNYYNIGANVKLPAHGGTVVFTAADGKNVFPLGKLAFSGALTLGGKTVFDRISLSASGTSFLCAGGNDLTLGTKVETVGDVVLLGGYNVGAEDTVESASISKDFTVNVLGGTYAYFRGGNRRTVGEAPFGMISGDCTFNLYNCTFTAKGTATNTSAAAGMNEQSGDVTVNVYSTTFAGNLFAVGRAGTNATVQKPAITGNITINFYSGILYGTRLDENQDNTIAFGGKYTLNLVGDSLPHVESIAGSETATITVSDALKNGGGYVQSTVKNPLFKGPDPWVIHHDGYYYLTVVRGVSIYCYRAATVDALAYVEPVIIWTAPKGDAVNDSNRHYSAEIWSSELHYISAEEFGKEYEGWWLYFAADDGNNVNHRIFAVRALTDDPLGAYGSPVTREVNVPVKMVVDNDETWAIGQSLLRANGKTYLTWTSETGRGTAEHKQDFRISLLKNPYTPVGACTVLKQAEFDWESHGYAYNAQTGVSYPKVVEGATAIYGDDGEVVITYSASGYWRPNYCLSTLTLKAGGDPIKAEDWIRATEPVFKAQNKWYGSGHASFTVDALGNRWMVFHAYDNWECGDSNPRYTLMQPWTMNGTSVEMNGGPYAKDITFSFVSRQFPVAHAIQGFAK